MNKTKVFADYSAFLNREDPAVNGVSARFAELNPEWEKENKTNKSCWNLTRCSRCSGCSGCYDCSRCSGCSGCYDCYGCSGCSRCSRCSRCSGCSDCYGCYDKRDLKGEKASEPGKSWFDVPVIPRLHSTVLAAVTDNGNKLDMSDWHKCETTHCRAGWIVFLAGQKGARLEEASSTLFAAMQIAKASSPIKVSPVRFFETNEVAMADIERCAAEEKAAAPAP